MMDRLEDAMRRLDDALRDAFRREEPPDGFAERVLRRADAQGVRKSGLAAWFRPPALRWALAAALCLVAAAGMMMMERQRGTAQRARGEAAKRQLMLALRITGSKLHLAQTKVRDIGRDPQRDTPRLERPL